MPSHTRPAIQFTIWNLIVVTVASSVVLGVGRSLGFEASASLFAVLYGIGPMFSFLSACLYPSRSKSQRVVVAVIISLLMLLFAVIFASVLNGLQSIPPLLFGTMCAWGAQWLFLRVVFLAWKEGLRAGRAP